MSEPEQEQVEDVPAEEAPQQEPQPSPEPSEEEQEAEDEEEQPGQPEEPEQEQPKALSQKDMENRLKRIAKSAEVWRARIPEVFEGDAEMFMPCPMCDAITPGYILMAPNVPERFPAVRVFMGDSQPRELRPDPDTEQCAVCGGEGLLDMRSKVQGQEALVCGYCNGQGWTGTRKGATAYVPPAPSPAGNGQQTGPMVHASADPPEVAALKAKGYTIIEPVRT